MTSSIASVTTLFTPFQPPWYVKDATGMGAGCVEAKLTLTCRTVLQPDAWSCLPSGTIILWSK